MVHKKGGKVSAVLLDVYGRFLSIIIMTAPTIAIAMIMETMPGNR
jgi:hypothetical protein